MPKTPAHKDDLCRVALMPSGRKGSVPKGSNLLQTAQELGVELESICGGRQTCGKCQIIVETGYFPKHGLTSHPDHLSPPSSLEEEYDQEHNLDGRRLACAAEIEGDVLITVPEESQAHKQIIAKEATQRIVEIDPAIRQVYVEVEPPELGDPRGDWERLSEALHNQWSTNALSIDIKLLPDLQSTLRSGDFKVTVTMWKEKEVVRVEPGYSEGIYGVAIDIGSTTVVAHLCDLRTGAVIATQAAMNPQVRFGEDLMSRISYINTEPQGFARMNRLIIKTINELIAKAAAGVNLSSQDVTEVVAVGNTVMHHIFVGINPRQLGVAPFALAIDSPLDIKARDLGLAIHPSGWVHILPIIAGHVGADNVGVMLAESPQEQEEITLIVDVGTNAEIILGDRNGVFVASSPTGPAFEGAQITHGQRAAPGAIERIRIDPDTLEPRFQVIGYPHWINPRSDEPLPSEAKATGICGSGIIEAVAELFLAGIINEKGHFVPASADRSPRVHYDVGQTHYVLVDKNFSSTSSPIVITQEDVRAIQLAKAALYAGTKLLMEHLGATHVGRVVLAGAFGTFISPYHAMVLGLFPDCELDKVIAVGNAAGDGARLALLNKHLRVKATKLARTVEYVETPLETTFQEEFVAALNLPHASDPFPHLAGILPERNAELPRKRRSRIKSKNRSQN